MSVTAKYRFNGNDYGLLAVAFPQTRIVGPPYYPFVTDQRIIVIDEQDPFERYPDKNIIQIISTASVALDSKEGFVRFLLKRGVRATADQWTQLLELEGGMFWDEAKYACVVGTFANIRKRCSPAEFSTVLDLFDALFEDFDAVYRHYEQLRPKPKPHQLVSSLTTMMLKTRAPEKERGRRYRQILEKNRKYEAHFILSVIEAFESDGSSMTEKMTDIDFLSFAADCSAHTRPNSLSSKLTVTGVDLALLYGL